MSELLTQRESELYHYLFEVALSAFDESIDSQVMPITVNLKGINQALNQNYNEGEIHLTLLLLEIKVRIINLKKSISSPEWQVSLFTFDLKHESNKQRSQSK